MRISVGDLYIHKDIGDTYLVTDTSSHDGAIGCINLDKGRPCWIAEIMWRTFYRPLTHSQEGK